jgi:hypothetical protein
MRRNILIAVNSAYLLFAALVVGVPIGVGALAAPVFFHTSGIDRNAAGFAMTTVFQGVGMLTNLSLSIMLLVAAFEVSYRKRNNTRRLLLARLVGNVMALLISVYMTEQLLPMMNERRALGDRGVFASLHGAYQQLTWVSIVLAVALIVITQAINIGPRRDGGHPRQV